MPNIPPVVVAGAAGLTQLVLARGARSGKGAWALGGLVAGAAVTLAGSAITTFQQVGTTVDPMEVDRAKALVDRGPFRFTRNPMYLGIAGVLLGHAIARRSVLATLPVAGFMAVMSTTQIPREEAALTAKFRSAYTDYLRRVPRWLGPIAETSHLQ